MPYDRKANNSTNYAHPNESNLWDVHKALQYDDYGQPVLRTYPNDPSATSKTAFGEPVANPITPVIQLDGLYGLQNSKIETFSAFGGTADTTGTLMRCQSGTSQYGYGVLRSRRAVRYRPGQGALTRFTAAFTEGTAGYTQRAGFFTQEQALQIGFDGENFGILRQNNGKAHIEYFTITSAASSGGNITIQLNGVNYVVPVTNADAGINAAEISEYFQANYSAGWTVEHCDGVVHFVSTSVGPNAGNFSYTDTDTTGLTATLTSPQLGVAHDDNWVYQNSFNIDTLDGNGPSKMILDPTKLNIYQVNFRWLGAGEMRFAIEDPSNGNMVFFHHIHYSNRNTDVHLDNPSLKIGYVAASLGGTGTNVTVTGASILGAVEGLVQTTSLPTAAFRSTNHNPNLAKDVLHHGLTVHNRLTFADKINTRELLVQKLSVSIDTNTAGNPVEILLFYNFDDVPSPAVQRIINDTESAAFYNNETGVVNAGNNVPIGAFFVAGQQGATFDLEDLRIAIPPNNNVTVCLQSTDTLSRVGVSLIFVED